MVRKGIQSFEGFQEVVFLNIAIMARAAPGKKSDIIYHFEVTI